MNLDFPSKNDKVHYNIAKVLNQYFWVLLRKFVAVL